MIPSKKIHLTEDKFKVFFDTSPDAIFIEDNAGNILYANNSACQLHEMVLEELIGKNVNVLMPKEVKKKFKTNRKNFERHQTEVIESFSLTKNGKEIPIELRINEINFEEEKAYLLYVRDISKRKNIENELQDYHIQLRNLSQHLQIAREAESVRIARDLHDDLGQVLTALKIDIVLLRKRLVKLENTLNLGNDLTNRTIEMERKADVTINTIRRISANLRPSILDDLGLLAAIEWQVEEFEIKNRISCTASLIFDERRVSNKMAITVFRIFQEALTNIIRHAKATEVNVKLVIQNNNLILEIQDNGIGITKEQIKHTQSFGIVGIKERVLSLNGQYLIDGKKDEGTSIRINIPIVEPKKAKA